MYGKGGARSPTRNVVGELEQKAGRKRAELLNGGGGSWRGYKYNTSQFFKELVSWIPLLLLGL
jgi:hypothetical protein